MHESLRNCVLKITQTFSVNFIVSVTRLPKLWYRLVAHLCPRGFLCRSLTCGSSGDCLCAAAILNRCRADRWGGQGKGAGSFGPYDPGWPYWTSHSVACLGFTFKSYFKVIHSLDFLSLTKCFILCRKNINTYNSDTIVSDRLFTLWPLIVCKFSIITEPRIRTKLDCRLRTRQGLAKATPLRSD